jgi:S-adenosylmethionine hydrolase
MASPIITLTTDWGLRDPFVGIMKGVILGICPGVRLVDLTHEIPPQDVLGGALALEAAAGFFPPGTVHLAVVDPGVGSPRRPIAVESGGQRFVGPDNGLLSHALRLPGWTCVALEAEAYRLPVVSATFHGRDVFAPAAAHLAAGIALSALGPPVPDPARLPWPEARMQGAELVGEVIGSDRFGNLLTSVTGEGLARLGPAASMRVRVGGVEVGGLLSCYADGGEGTPAAIIGSGGRLEIFVRCGSARDVLGGGRGTPVRVGTRSG